MPTLKERLATLSATRKPAGSRAAEPFPSAMRSARRPAGYSITERLVPLGARSWLGQLPGCDPQAAALLVREPEAEIPPLSDWLFLDLETTGLAGGTGTHAFLVGIGQLTTEGFRIRQFFLRDLAAEGALLTALVPIFRQASALVTYNGKLFDAALLDMRFRLARMPFDFHALLHFDLLYPARVLWKLRWGSVRLGDLERSVLRYERPEDVPGELIPQLYFDYLRSGNEHPLRIVFQHNTADLVSLAALAARMLQLVSAPETSSKEPLELFALGRLYERARRPYRAGTLYEGALASGLPGEVERAALRRLSLLYKRQRDYKRAVMLWGELAEMRAPDSAREKLEAYQELAICYEHRLGELDAAVEVTQRALAELNRLLILQPENRARYRRAKARFTHRLSRLNYKRAPLALGGCRQPPQAGQRGRLDPNSPPGRSAVRDR